MPNKKYNQNTPESIQALFSSIASNYDRGNAILSFGLYKRWNHHLIQATAARAPAGAILLDLCAGTGDIGLAAIKKFERYHAAYLLDFCPEMLTYAKAKAHQHQLDHKNIQFIVGDAQSIPLPDASVDVATTAYGIRNIQDPLKCAHEVYRLLKPGGCWGILELTRPRFSILRGLHQLYLNALLPCLGKLVATNKEAYQYLSRSIQHFISPEELTHQLQLAGFTDIQTKPLYGGIATLILAQKNPTFDS